MKTSLGCLVDSLVTAKCKYQRDMQDRTKYIYNKI
jgi:hypothetical protein